MKKLLICFLFLTAVAGAQNYIPSPSTPRLMNEKGYISSSNPLPVASSGGSSEGILASETIGLLDAIDGVKQAVEGLVVDTSAVVMAIEEQGTNASEATILAALEALNDTPTEFRSRYISVWPNSSQPIVSQLLSSSRRIYIEIHAIGDVKEFWLDYMGADAIIGKSQLVHGGVGIRLPKNISPRVIASEALEIFVVEAGR